MDEKNRGRIVAGVVLIFLGLVFLANQFVGGFSDAAILFLIGAVFLAGYFYSKSYGLLIPGCILMGLGVFACSWALGGTLPATGRLLINVAAGGLLYLVVMRLFFAQRLREGAEFARLALRGTPPQDKDDAQ